MARPSCISLFARLPRAGGEDCARIVTIDPPSRAAAPAPLIFSAPHSGRCYPRDFVRQSALSLDELRLSEDFLADRLFAAASAHGGWRITAQRPRAWLDLNRHRLELDPEVVEGPLPADARTGTSRVKAGLGVIPRIVSRGKTIHARKLTLREAQARLAEGYDPYHAQLTALVRRQQRLFGQAVLIDCHTMPASAARAMTPLAGKRPHVILGDRDGESCSPLLTDTLDYLFTRAGLRVSRNRVYSGGHITRHYGASGLGAHAIQIEINRELYMRPGCYEPTADFHDLQAIVTGIVRELPARLTPLWRPLHQAAE